MKAHKWGNGVGICLSQKLTQKVDLRPGQEVEVIAVRPGEVWIQWDPQQVPGVDQLSLPLDPPG